MTLQMSQMCIYVCAMSRGYSKRCDVTKVQRHLLPHTCQPNATLNATSKPADAICGCAGPIQRVSIHALVIAPILECRCCAMRDTILSGTNVLLPGNTVTVGCPFTSSFCLFKLEAFFFIAMSLSNGLLIVLSTPASACNVELWLGPGSKLGCTPASAAIWS